MPLWFKKKSKQKNQTTKKKISLELLHQILRHMSTRSLLDEDTENVWQYIEIRVDHDPFYTLCQILTIKKFYIKDTTESQNTLQMCVHGHHTSHIFQKINTRHYI